MSKRTLLVAVLIACILTAIAWTMRVTSTPVPVTTSTTTPQNHVVPAPGTSEAPRPSVPTAAAPERPTRSADQPPTAEQCRAVIRDAMTELARYDDERFESIRIDLDQLANYRGLGVDQLKSLAVQGDADAMIVLTMAVVTEAIGLGDTNAVPLARGEVDLDDAGLNEQDALNRLNEREVVNEASHWLYEAAVHGRLEAFAGVGEPLEALTAVDMGWLDAEEFAELPEKTQRILKPNAVYRTAYFLLDPNLLPSGAANGYENWLSDERDAYGPYLDTVVRPLADGFIEDVRNRGLSLPEIAPRRSIEEHLESIGSDCRPE